MGLCEDDPSCDKTYNAVMPLSRASTRGRYSRIMGVTGWEEEKGVGGARLVAARVACHERRGGVLIFRIAGASCFFGSLNVRDAFIGISKARQRKLASIKNLCQGSYMESSNYFFYWVNHTKNHGANGYLV